MSCENHLANQITEILVIRQSISDGQLHIISKGDSVVNEFIWFSSTRARNSFSLSGFHVSLTASFLLIYSTFKIKRIFRRGTYIMCKPCIFYLECRNVWLLENSVKLSSSVYLYYSPSSFGITLKLSIWQQPEQKQKRWKIYVSKTDLEMLLRLIIRNHVLL